MWLLLPVLAFANDPACLPLGPQVDHAWEQYRDAEVDAAKAALTEAYASLSCQTEVLSTGDLLALYRLDALVSITQDDQKGAVYATIRSVAAQHVGARPPEEYGPSLAELYDTWAQRLGAALVELTVEGGGDVYVDGRQITLDEPLLVAQGEHVIQVVAPGNVQSEVVDVAAPYVVETGLAAPGPGQVPGEVPPFTEPVVPFVPVPSAPAPAPAPTPVAVSPPADASSKGKRKRPAWAFAGAALAGGGGAFALGSAVVSEGNFLSDPYAGLGEGRADAITRDAQSIRTAYLVGYGLSAVSAGLLTVGIVGLPAAEQGPLGGLSLRGRW